MAQHVENFWEINCYKIFVRKARRKISFDTLRCRWEVNIKMKFKEMNY